MAKGCVLGIGLMAAGILGTAGPAAAGELPADVKARGALNLSINLTYPPLDFKDPATNEPMGVDSDLANELAKRLGLKITWTDVPFAQLIPSLTTKRTDFIWSGISDLPARRETMDFVDYIKSGAQFYTLTATAGINAPEDLCGKKVGSIRSTAYPKDIEAWSEANCVKAGKPAIEFIAGENSPDVRTQLKQGRIDAAVQGSETIPYLSSQENNVFKLLGKPFTTTYYGIAFRKDETAFRDLVADTLEAMVKDGAYGRIMDKWQLSAIVVPALTINGQPR